MLRRLYFLFPSPQEALAAVDELVINGTPRNHMHALARPDVDLTDLPPATERQRNGMRARLAHAFWRADLLVFAVALLGLIIALLLAHAGWALALVVIMALCFAAGAIYAIALPEMEPQEFVPALRHGEVLLLVDAPADQVATIESTIHRHHPSAVAGGSSWSVDAFGI